MTKTLDLEKAFDVIRLAYVKEYLDNLDVDYSEIDDHDLIQIYSLLYIREVEKKS